MSAIGALAAVFAAVCCAAYGAVVWADAGASRLRRRLADIGAGPDAGGAVPRAAAAAPSAVSRHWRRLVRPARPDAPRSPRARRAAILLRRAGMALRPEEFLAAVAGAALLLALLGLAVHGVLGAVAGGLLGGWLPWAVVGHLARRRLQAFQERLPDALSLIANSLRSGYAFMQALDTAGQELPPPTGPELAHVVRETRLDVPLEDALEHLLDRVPSPDLDLVATAVLIQRQVGGNLAQVLEQISTTIRQRMRLQGQVRALTAQGRLSGWIVGVLPMALAVLLFLMDPSYMGALFDEPAGHLILGGALVMEGIGALLIRRLVQLEV